MRLSSFETIARALDSAGVRYLVAGGLEKGMRVLQFWSDAHRETPIDMFVDEPFAFQGEYDRALVKPLHATIPVRFVSLRTLIEMKQQAGRPQDLLDIAQLRMQTDRDADA
jgi:hypothetical protein